MRKYSIYKINKGRYFCKKKSKKSKDNLSWQKKSFWVYSSIVWGAIWFLKIRIIFGLWIWMIFGLKIRISQFLSIFYQLFENILNDKVKVTLKLFSSRNILVLKKFFTQFLCDHRLWQILEILLKYDMTRDFSWKFNLDYRKEERNCEFNWISI